MIEIVHLFKCDACFGESISYDLSVPYGWWSRVYATTRATGYGYTIKRSQSKHFCSEDCQVVWEEDNPEWSFN